MLKYKINQIKGKIQNVIDIYNPYLALSFGKDSTLLFYIIKDMGLNIKCLYRYYKEELPEIKIFREYLTKKFNIDLDIVKNEKIRSQFKPHHELTYIQSNKRINIVEKQVMTNYAKNKGYNCAILGLRSDESKTRLNNFKMRGYLYYNKSLDMNISCPLSNLKIYEIQMIYDYYKIPLSEIYNNNLIFQDNQLRSTDYDFLRFVNKGQLMHYKQYNPALYIQILKKYPELKQWG